MRKAAYRTGGIGRHVKRRPVVNTPEPKRPRTNYYDGRAYFSLIAGKSNKDVAVEVWRKD